MRSKSGRCYITESQQNRILLFTAQVIKEGLTLHDAASILSINPATLKGWAS